MNTFDSFALSWFTAVNITAFLAFGFDKWRAARSARRVPESVLILLAALGGWPGALLGMNFFRHKTVKWTFKLKIAFAFIPFAGAVWAWIHFR